MLRRCRLGLALVVGSALVLAPSAARAQAKTPEEEEVLRQRVIGLMSQEGLSKENCYLKGIYISSSPRRYGDTPYPDYAFPYKWDFDDGSRCGIEDMGAGIQNVSVREGRLTFRADEVPEISCYPWDLAGGMAGEKVDARKRGKGTALGEKSLTVAVRATVIDAAAAAGLPAGAEEGDSRGALKSCLGDQDLDGAAIHSTTGNGGLWQYSTDDGETWQDVGKVSSEQALLLESDDRIRYVLVGDSLKAAHLSWGDFDASKAPLHFGYGTGHDERVPPLEVINVRMRQSVNVSTWQVAVKSVVRGKATVVHTENAVVKGKGWQTVRLSFESGATPRFTAFRLQTRTPGNNVEIDWIRPCTREGRRQYRKTFALPAPVRWAKVSLVASTYFGFYVNGELAAKAPPHVRHHQIWNYDVAPSLFRVGRNAVGVECSTWFGGGFLLDGALLCEDGTYLRFDSDTTWKGSDGPEDLAACTNPDYDDAGWREVNDMAAGNSRLHPPQDDWQLLWFNPSWKGQTTVKPVDGRSQPVFGSKEAVALKVTTPARGGETHEVSWRLLDEMGDYYHAEDRLVREGTLRLKREGRDSAGLLSFPAGSLPHNVAYALDLRFKVDGKEAERRRYELAVCGPVDQPIVQNRERYTDGMELKLVWEMDAAAEQKSGGFISCDGASQVRESKVVETPLGRFRRTYAEENVGTVGGGLANYISFKYTIETPGRPHVAVAEYPDDAIRIQEMRVNDCSFWGGMTTLANDTVVLGIEQPLTHKIRHHHAVFFPNENVGTVTFFALGYGERWNTEMAAHVGKIRIYEILNDIPAEAIADAPGPRKWIGQQPEAGPRQVMQSCFTSPLASLMRNFLIQSDAPNFYRNWMVTYMNMVKRLRFAGENAYHYGQFMYDNVLYPSVYSDHTAFGNFYSGSLRDSGVLMAKMFEENGLGLFSSLEMVALSRLTLAHSDEEVVRGAPTLAQVTKEGRQLLWLGRRSIYPNWIHPEVRKHFETVIRELIELYGKQKGWKGITLQINEELGPCWVSMGGDPYYASYDDYTISRFEAETGVSVPVGKDDPKRFRKRYVWLLENRKREWTDWRCAKMTEIYEWIRDRLRETRPDLKLVLFTNAISYMNPPIDPPERGKLPVFGYSRRGGLDFERFVKDPDVVCCHTVNGDVNMHDWFRGRENGLFRSKAHDDEFLSAITNDGLNGVTVRYNWFEPQPTAPEGWLWVKGCDAEAWPYPSAEYFSDYWTNIFIRTNPVMIVHSLQDLTMWMGREVSMSRFAKAYRSLPIGRYTRLMGLGLDRNVWIGTTQHRDETYGYIANPQWWEVEAQLAFAPGARAHDLIAGRPIVQDPWRVSLAPYGIRTFRVDGAEKGAPVGSCSATASARGQSAVREMVQAAAKGLEECRETLKNAGKLSLIEPLVRRAKDAVSSGDYSLAYETLTLYPYLSAAELLRERTHSPWIVRGWKLSNLMPKKGALKDVACPRLADDIGWRDVQEIPRSNRVLSYSTHGKQDGIAYLGLRINVPLAREWGLLLGHDGACALFVDGKLAALTPERRNPILEDRTQVTVELTKGTHEVMVALDTDSGMGWGITFRFQAPGNKSVRAAEFPCVATE